MKSSYSAFFIVLFFQNRGRPGGCTLIQGLRYVAGDLLQRCIQFYQKLLHYYGNMLHHSHKLQHIAPFLLKLFEMRRGKTRYFFELGGKMCHTAVMHLVSDFRQRELIIDQ